MVGTPLTLNLLEDQGWANKKIREKSIGMSFPQGIGHQIMFSHQKANLKIMLHLIMTGQNYPNVLFVILHIDLSIV